MSNHHEHIRQFIRNLRAKLELTDRDPEAAQAAASAEAEQAYREAVAEERADAGSAPSGPIEAAFRRARRALVQAYERARGLHLLPVPLVPYLRERAARVRCHVASFGTACLGASAEAIGTLVAAVTLATAVAGTALPTSSDLAALPSHARVVEGTDKAASIRATSPRTVAPALAEPIAAPLGAQISSSTAPGTPGPRAEASTAVDPRRSIGIARHDVSVTVGDREYAIARGEGEIIYCDPNAPVRRMACDVSDAVGAGG